MANCPMVAENQDSETNEDSCSSKNAGAVAFAAVRSFLNYN